MIFIKVTICLQAAAFYYRYASLNDVLSAGQNRFYYKGTGVSVIPNGCEEFLIIMGDL